MASVDPCWNPIHMQSLIEDLALIFSGKIDLTESYKMTTGKRRPRRMTDDEVMRVLAKRALRGYGVGFLFLRSKGHIRRYPGRITCRICLGNRLSSHSRSIADK